MHQPSHPYHSGPPAPNEFTAPQHHQPSPQELRDASMAQYMGMVSWIIPLVMRSNAGAFSPFVRAHASASANIGLTGVIGIFGTMFLVCGFSFLVAITTDGPLAMLFGGGLLTLLMCGLAAWQIVMLVKGGNAAKIGNPPPQSFAFRMFK